MMNRYDDAAVHPELREVLIAYREVVGDGGLAAILDVTERRRVFNESSRRASQGRSMPADVRVDSFEVPGLAGAPDVRVRLYRPDGADEAAAPAWIYLHGGGMVVGGLDSSDLAVAGLAADSGSVILSVDYRLAPETRFPGPVDDAVAALGWLHGGARELGVDPARIGVYGVSAGGLLAASLAQRSRDGDAAPLAKQLLIYPMLDDRSPQQPSTPDAPAATWSREANAQAWDYYLGPDVDRDNPPAGSVPARAASLRGLPSAYVEVGSVDILAAEDMSYAGRLLSDGVPTELHVYPGAYHAFDVMVAGSSLARSARARRVAAMTEI